MDCTSSSNAQHGSGAQARLSRRQHLQQLTQWHVASFAGKSAQQQQWARYDKKQTRSNNMAVAENDRAAKIRACGSIDAHPRAPFTTTIIIITMALLQKSSLARTGGFCLSSRRSTITSLNIRGAVRVRVASVDVAVPQSEPKKDARGFILKEVRFLVQMALQCVWCGPSGCGHAAEHLDGPCSPVYALGML